MADGSLHQKALEFQTRKRFIEYHLLTSEYIKRCGDNVMALFYCLCKALLHGLKRFAGLLYGTACPRCERASDGRFTVSKYRYAREGTKRRLSRVFMSLWYNYIICA